MRTYSALLVDQHTRWLDKPLHPAYLAIACDHQRRLLAGAAPHRPLWETTCPYCGGDELMAIAHTGNKRVERLPVVRHEGPTWPTERGTDAPVSRDVDCAECARCGAAIDTLALTAPGVWLADRSSRLLFDDGLTDVTAES